MRSPITAVVVIAASAIVSLGGVAVMALQGSPETEIASGEMSTGVTVTAPHPVAEVSKAVPGITGPAPLPKEEQGLPGD